MRWLGILFERKMVRIKAGEIDTSVGCSPCMPLIVKKSTRWSPRYSYGRFKVNNQRLKHVGL
jgi:hypothetical protein